MLEARKALHTEYANSLETNSSFTSSTMISTPKSPKKKPIFEPFGLTFGDDASDSPLGSRRFSDSEATAQITAAESRPQVQFRILAGNTRIIFIRRLPCLHVHSGSDLLSGRSNLKLAQEVARQLGIFLL